MNALQNIVRIVKSIFPQTCAGCGERLSYENVLCVKCMYELSFTDHHQVFENKFTQHFYGRVNIQKGAAFLDFRKKGVAQELMHKLKYGGKYFIGEYLGEMAAEKIEKSGFLANIDLIIPVPLHKIKRNIRGYNQCEAFAKGLSTYTEIPYSTNVLLKSKHTSTQTSKSRIERIKNVESSFEVSDEIDLNGKHVLLVDDVITTGATLEACALILQNKFPAIKISMYTMVIANS